MAPFNGAASQPNMYIFVMVNYIKCMYTQTKLDLGELK